jgi:hypothetical protein
MAESQGVYIVSAPPTALRDVRGSLEDVMAAELGSRGIAPVVEPV